MLQLWITFLQKLDTGVYNSLEAYESKRIIQEKNKLNLGNMANIFTTCNSTTTKQGVQPQDRENTVETCVGNIIFPTGTDIAGHPLPAIESGFTYGEIVLSVFLFSILFLLLYNTFISKIKGIKVFVSNL